jgi:hypothetical protein
LKRNDKEADSCSEDLEESLYGEGDEGQAKELDQMLIKRSMQTLMMIKRKRARKNRRLACEIDKCYQVSHFKFK